MTQENQADAIVHSEEVDILIKSIFTKELGLFWSKENESWEECLERMGHYCFGLTAYLIQKNPEYEESILIRSIQRMAKVLFEDDDLLQIINDVQGADEHPFDKINLRAKGEPGYHIHTMRSLASVLVSMDPFAQRDAIMTGVLSRNTNQLDALSGNKAFFGDPRHLAEGMVLMELEKKFIENQSPRLKRQLQYEKEIREFELECQEQCAVKEKQLKQIETFLNSGSADQQAKSLGAHLEARDQVFKHCVENLSQEGDRRTVEKRVFDATRNLVHLAAEYALLGQPEKSKQCCEALKNRFKNPLDYDRFELFMQNGLMAAFRTLIGAQHPEQKKQCEEIMIDLLPLFEEIYEGAFTLKSNIKKAFNAFFLRDFLTQLEENPSIAAPGAMERLKDIEEGFLENPLSQKDQAQKILINIDQWVSSKESIHALEDVIKQWSDYKNKYQPMLSSSSDSHQGHEKQADQESRSDQISASAALDSKEDLENPEVLEKTFKRLVQYLMSNHPDHWRETAIRLEIAIDDTLFKTEAIDVLEKAREGMDELLRGPSAGIFAIQSIRLLNDRLQTHAGALRSKMEQDLLTYELEHQKLSKLGASDPQPERTRRQKVL